MPKASDTSSVQKVCRVLRALSAPRPLRLVDIAETANLNKATALRLLEALGEEGFVERDGPRQRYRLGEHARLMVLATEDPGRARDERAEALAAATCGIVRGHGAAVGAPGRGVRVHRPRVRRLPVACELLDVGSRRPLA
jgi:predicted transcriptional regulator